MGNGPRNRLFIFVNHVVVIVVSEIVIRFVVIVSVEIVVNVASGILTCIVTSVCYVM